MIHKKIKKLKLKREQRFGSNKNNVFTEESNKIAFISNDDEKILSIDSVKATA